MIVKNTWPLELVLSIIEAGLAGSFPSRTHEGEVFQTFMGMSLMKLSIMK